MIRPLPAALALAAALALTGCGGGDQPAATPSPSTPATSAAASPSPSSTSTEQDDRFACRESVKKGNGFDLEIGANVSIAALAKQSSDPGIATAGQVLAAAVDAKQYGTIPETEANLRIADAQLDLAKACAARFGDGPW